MSAFLTIVARDLSLARRRGGEAAMAILFFVLAVVLFPLGLGPEPRLLSQAGPGIIWVMALLSMLLSLDRLFQADWEDGSLELLLLAPLPLSLAVLAKCLAHWLMTGLPMVLAAPLLGTLMHVPGAMLKPLTLGMLLGTPVLTLMGAVGAALSVGARRGGLLMTLLVLPLYIPILIFGAGAVDAAVAVTGARAHFLVLGAFLSAALALVPWTVAAALRQTVE